MTSWVFAASRRSLKACSAASFPSVVSGIGTSFRDILKKLVGPLVGLPMPDYITLQGGVILDLLATVGKRYRTHPAAPRKGRITQARASAASGLRWIDGDR